MRWEWHLDKAGEAPVSPGYTLVETEAELLRKALSDEPLFIRGQALSRWAEQLCRARGWRYELRESPVRELRKCCPDLDNVQASELASRLGLTLATLSRPLEARVIARALWPESIWESDPETQHAARWLLWLIEAEPSEPEQALLHCIGRTWQDSALGPESRAYTASTSAEAWKLLKEWLSLTSPRSNWPEFPVFDELSTKVWSELKTTLRDEIVDTKGAFFEELRHRGATKRLLRYAAKVAGMFYLNNKDKLSESVFEMLGPYLEEDTRRRLLELVPPKDPGDPPEDLTSAIDWFQRYLRFRQWEATYGGTVDHSRVQEIAKKFGLWYLRSYSKASLGGQEAQHLNWVRASSMVGEKSDSSVILMIILDGLRYDDAERLLSFVEEESERLLLDSDEVVLSTLPTITPFAKPALLQGAQPKRAIDEAVVSGPVEKEDSKVLEALVEADPGDKITWSLLEPDKTYHAREGKDTLQQEVQFRLQFLARRIATVAERAPAQKNLRIVITTDHGRLLGSSKRTHRIPSGMEAQGRAAWGEVNLEFPEEGFIVSNNLAYLNAGTFGLPQHCAVLLTDESFLTSDGRGGTDFFVHGGLYPEEVFIPWIEFTRDRGLPNLQSSLAGGGVAGAEGSMMLSVKNLSDVAVKLVGLETAVGRTFEISRELRPMTVEEISIPWTPWPSAQELADIELRLRYTLPSEEVHTLSIEKTSLESEQMYAMDEDILGELGGSDEL